MKIFSAMQTSHVPTGEPPIKAARRDTYLEDVTTPVRRSTVLPDYAVLAPKARAKASAPRGGGLTDCLETGHLVDVLPRLSATSIAVFDIDMTLTVSQGDPHRVATVEPNTAAFVRGLQDCGVPVLGLTARAPKEIAGVQQKLAALNIDLSLTSPLPEHTQFASKHASLYGNGIICAGDFNTKGEMLALLHDAVPFAHAVMIDDNVNHFFSSIRAARSARFDLTCVSYNAALPPGAYAMAWQLVKRLADKG